jgi:hypothetical protein
VTSLPDRSACENGFRAHGESASLDAANATLLGSKTGSGAGRRIAKRAYQGGVAVKSDPVGANRRRPRRLLHALGGLMTWALVSTTILSTPASADRSPGASACGPTISVASLPSLKASRSWLNGVAALSDNSVWAVGAFVPTGQNNQRTLIEHWNGTAWSVQPSANEGGTTTLNELSAIAAVSAIDIWAVGDHGSPAPEPQKPLLEHFLGGTWHATPSPDLGPGHHFLTGVSAISASDVWAVGYSIGSSGVYSPVAEHWNGSKWSVASVKVPKGSGSEFYGVFGSRSSDVWAVGAQAPGVSGGRPLVEHWNGKQWSIVATPIVVSTWNGQWLDAIDGKSTNDVWAAGTRQPNVNNFAGLIEHWNGASWTVIPSADPPASSGDYLRAVSEAAPTDIWAVGNDDINGFSGTLVEHWNGAAWTIVPSPNPGPDMGGGAGYPYNQLNGVAASTDAMWTAGVFGAPPIPAREEQLVEQQCG